MPHLLDKFLNFGHLYWSLLQSRWNHHFWSWQERCSCNLCRSSSSACKTYQCIRSPMLETKWELLKYRVQNRLSSWAFQTAQTCFHWYPLFQLCRFHLSQEFEIGRFSADLFWSRYCAFYQVGYWFQLLSRQKSCSYSHLGSKYQLWPSLHFKVPCRWWCIYLRRKSRITNHIWRE